jgi:hypothetical protein
MLAELLSAYGLGDAQRRLHEAKGDEASATRKRERARSGAPSDPAEYQALRRRELEAARPQLAVLVPQVRELRGRLPRPGDRAYRERWTAIRDAWNAAVYNAGWLTLPPLCEVCGLPVLMRAPERQGQRVELSTVCSPGCQNQRKVARHRQRTKGKARR